MVADFGFVKDIMMHRIHTPCDHGIIVYMYDNLLQDMFAYYPDSPKNHCPQVLKILWLPTVPTAENLAEYWFNEMKDDVVHRSQGLARLVAVEVNETPNCQAVYAVEAYQ